MTFPALSLSAGCLLFLLEFGQLLFDLPVVVRREAELPEKVVAVERQLPILGGLDLRGGEAIRVGQVGPPEVGPGQGGLLEVGPPQVGPLEVGLPQVGPLEVGVLQRRLSQEARPPV